MKYKVLNEIEISGSNLTHNFNYFLSRNSDLAIAPVLKANAYGHGLTNIAHFVQTHLTVPFICVDSLYEAYELMKSGIKSEIFIMGYTDPTNYAVWKKLPFIFSVWDNETIEALNRDQPGARIHIKLDTGMSRLGLMEDEITKFLGVLKKCTSLRVQGIYSHLASADDPNQASVTNSQIASFKKMVRLFEREGYDFKWKHIASSAGASYINDNYFNLIRLGLGFYGYTPFSPKSKIGQAQKNSLKPALTLRSTIAAIKKLTAGDRVGYGGTYTAKNNEEIVILPLGYNEGLSRDLSNSGSVLIKDIACPIVGRICMNMTTVKLPRAMASLGDKVIVVSNDPDAACSIYQIADKLNTIPYTVLTALSSTIRRRVI
ncbi:MAG: Alanine racemase [Microgenomates group bacterium GW2011_GWF2_47_9]|nr:MAG: Alanine racemase [Microgenomates group bacterium GW2011_GWF2_47_9]